MLCLQATQASAFCRCEVRRFLNLKRTPCLLKILRSHKHSLYGYMLSSVEMQSYGTRLSVRT